MPKNKFQDVIFTIIMVFVMVYTMICYNIALNVGGMNNQVFLNAFHELVIMGPIAFILDFFLIGPFAKKKAFSIVNLERDNKLSPGDRHFRSIHHRNVSTYEPRSNPALQECGNPVHIRLVPDHCNQLPNGILLAALLRRSTGKKDFRIIIPRKRNIQNCRWSGSLIEVKCKSI